MKSNKLMYQVSGTDEAYTPAYGVRPIVKYICPTLTVWCPFDKPHSEYVKQLLANGNKVIHSHLDDGLDFFEYEPDNWDIIVSNPPFRKKRLFFERALAFNKPFALLMTLTCLNDKYPKFSFYEAGRKLELLMFDKRINFEHSGDTTKKITFSSGYYCSGVLENQIELEELLYDDAR